jgi:predicted amidophosphoribosyltransferase
VSVKHKQTKCVCPSCWAVMIDSFLGHVREIGAPADPAAVVYVREYTVRAHWSRNPRAYQYNPEMREEMERIATYQPRKGKKR